MPTHTATNRLRGIKEFFDQGDEAVGYRRLLDAVLDTADLNVFAEALQFCSHLETDPENRSERFVLIDLLLEKIAQVPVNDPTEPKQVKLQATDIVKKYGGGSFCLGPVSLTARTGSIVGLVGENGNGKTTILRLLAGELRADSGNIQYQIATGKSDSYALRSSIAYLPQRHPVWYGSLLDNLRFTAAHYGRRNRENELWVEIILARMGLRPFRNLDWSRLSSGYKTRFELARSLLRKPQILLLDEPLANLDLLAQQVILEDIRFLSQSLRHPMAVLLSSQHLYEVEKVSESVLFLRNGSPQWLGQTSVEKNENSQLVVELETTASKSELLAAVQQLKLEQISYNGGVYLLYFNDTRFKELLQTLAQSSVTLRYVRDISQSSRRFFDQERK